MGRAIAVELAGARLPRPTRRLYREMATAAYTAMRIHMRTVDDRELPELHTLTPKAWDALEAAAHAAYAIVAVRGGGRVRRIAAPGERRR